MSFSTIISEYSSSRKSAPLMTRRGSSSCPLVKKASARATRSGVRARPSRSGSGSMARSSARTCCSRSFAGIRSGSNRSAPASQGALVGDHALAAQVLEDGARPGRAVEGVEVDRVVVEELRDHHVEARVHLHLQVLDVALEVAALRMPLGMPGPDQAEVVPALADEADHVERVAKAVRRRPEAGILRAVAADR